MSVDPDNYSLDEFVKLNRRAKNIAASLKKDNELEANWVRERGTYHWDRLYNLNGEAVSEFIADLRRVLGDGGVDEPVRLRTKVRGYDKPHELTVYVGDKGKEFLNHTPWGNDDMFLELVAWVDEEVRRKDWVDGGHAGALYDGAL